MSLPGSAYLVGSLRPATHTSVAVYARLYSLDRAAAAEVRRAPLRAWPSAGPRRQAAAGRTLQCSRVDPGDRFCEARSPGSHEMVVKKVLTAQRPGQHPYHPAPRRAHRSPPRPPRPASRPAAPPSDPAHVHVPHCTRPQPAAMQRTRHRRDQPPRTSAGHENVVVCRLLVNSSDLALLPRLPSPCSRKAQCRPRTRFTDNGVGRGAVMVVDLDNAGPGATCDRAVDAQLRRVWSADVHGRRSLLGVVVSYSAARLGTQPTAALAPSGRARGRPEASDTPRSSGR